MTKVKRSSRARHFAVLPLAAILVTGLAALAAAQGTMGGGQRMGPGGMGGMLMESPIEPTKESLQRGGELFATHCAACHGPEGRGDGPAAQGMRPPPANLYRVAGDWPDRAFYMVLAGIRPHLQRRAPAVARQMPNFAQVLSQEERWHIVNYIQHGLRQ